MQKVLFRVFAVSLSVVYSFLVVVGILLRWLRHPTVPFWRVKSRDTPPRCLTDPAYGTHSYAALKDVKLHYVEKGDRSKPLMLLVHGFPEFWYSWRHQIKEFSKDYWTVAIDLRGYGDSDKPSGTAPYDIDLLTEDLRQLIGVLGREQCDVLVAHDWGGVIAWHFVFTHPQLVKRYVIMDAPYPPLYAKLVRSSPIQFFKAWYTFFFQAPILPELLMRSNDLSGFSDMLRTGKTKESSPVTDQDIEAFKYTFGKPGALTPPINYYRCNMWRSATTRKQGKKEPREDMPRGLLLFGENDSYLHEDFMRLSVERVKNLRGELVMGGNHFVQQDEPKAVNAAMRRFLAS